MAETVSYVAEMYKQMQIGIGLYRSNKHREFRSSDPAQAPRHLALACEWATGKEPQGFPEDGWIWDSLRQYLKDEGGSVRRANAGGDFTESYLDGDEIKIRQIPAIAA